MSRKVFKYPLPRNRQKFEIALPPFKFLRVGFQNENLFMWCEVEPERGVSTSKFSLYGTGQDISDNAVYLATYDDGPFVFHLYQE